MVRAFACRSYGSGRAWCSSLAPSPDRTAPQRVLCSTSSHQSIPSTAGTSSTREAHPGEHLPAHERFEDKLAAARRLRDELGITRPILVDDLAGAVHTAYGLMPNMSWVLGRGGTILYKAAWTSAERIGDFLERLRARPRGLGHAPFHTEQ